MKASRQSKILDIIEHQDIETQEELGRELARAGFPSTQATISRDIRELKLVKMALPGGRQKYMAVSGTEQSNKIRYGRVLKDGILTMEAAGNIVVIRTVSGLAMAVAAALDQLDIYGIIGCVAGDDTIFAAIRQQDMADSVIESISRFAQDQNEEE